MGLNYSTCELLRASDFFAKLKDKTGSTEVLTLGRQSVRLSLKQKYKLAANLNTSYQEIESLISAKDGYCESVMNFMGADAVSSLDYSDYEGVNYTGNLNEKLCEGDGSSLQSKFDAVFDFGTTQMVFNPAQSIDNSLSFLKVGGALVLVLPVSGLVNHGLYQFGPHFFNALANKDFLNVNTFYYEKTRSANAVKVWRTLNPFFDFNHKFIMSFCVIQKVSPFSSREFLENTQMVRYERPSVKGESSGYGPRLPTRAYKHALLKYMKKTPVLRNILCSVLSSRQSMALNRLHRSSVFENLIQ